LVLPFSHIGIHSLATKLLLNDTVDLEREVKRELLKRLRITTKLAKGDFVDFIEAKKPLPIKWSGFFL
jgi:hypothetical protein